MRFPTSPFEEIHEVAKGKAAVSLDTIIDQMRQNPKQGCLSLRWPVVGN
jgi:hypothetical protein